MATRQWTVVLVPHGAGQSRAVKVSLRGFRILVTLLAAVAVTAIAFGYATITRAVDLSRLDRLERRNELLAQELDRAQHVLANLGDTIAAIAERDEMIRLLAGLDPIDPDVQLAGVGGPAEAGTPGDQILAEGPEGQQALAVRAQLDNFIRRASLLASSYDEAVTGLQEHTDRLERTPSLSPIAPTAGWITSNYNRARMHPIYHQPKPHMGIDITARPGTPILAPASGRVIEVRAKTGYGKTVTIDHGYGVQTFYAHCSRTLVEVGQWVQRNDKIAEVGRTGTATGPHLHYEVLVNQKPVDPRKYIFPAFIVD